MFFFLLPDFPEESKWLREDEKVYVAARLRLDQGKSARERPITLKDIGNVFKDYKVFVAGFMCMYCLKYSTHLRHVLIIPNTSRFRAHRSGIWIRILRPYYIASYDIERHELTSIRHPESSRATDTARLRPSCTQCRPGRRRSYFACLLLHCPVSNPTAISVP